MLFFRSEEQAKRWCEARGVAVGPLVTIPQLWRLSTAWYSNRLHESSRRPQPDEMVRIFADIGLAGDFWDPHADTFG